MKCLNLFRNFYRVICTRIIFFQVPPLPTLLNNRQQTEHPQSSGDKFLFPTSSGSDSLQANDLTELQRKVTVLKSLINEYNALTEREKTKVQTVHDYLVTKKKKILNRKFQKI